MVMLYGGGSMSAMLRRRRRGVERPAAQGGRKSLQRQQQYQQQCQLKDSSSVPVHGGTKHNIRPVKIHVNCVDLLGEPAIGQVAVRRQDYNFLFFSGYPQRGFYMRVVQILGALLIAGGLFILIKSPSYSSEKSLIKIGDVEAKVAEQHEIPAWAGGAALAAGVVLIVVGARRR